MYASIYVCDVFLQGACVHMDRYNMDPLSAYTDDALWTALGQAHARAFVEALEGQLSFAVSEGGSNISQGQRQQIALARSILRKPNIFLMDEGALPRPVAWGQPVWDGWTGT